MYDYLKPNWQSVAVESHWYVCRWQLQHVPYRGVLDTIAVKDAQFRYARLSRKRGAYDHTVIAEQILRTR